MQSPDTCDDFGYANRRLNCSSAGIFMPGRLGCTRVVERLSTSASMADHTCTSLPLTVSIRASAMPQVPAPRTPIFRFVTFVSSVCTGSQAAGEFARHRQTRCARCYAHCTRKRLPRQPACRIAQSSRSGWAVFVHNTRFLQTICTAGRFML